MKIGLIWAQARNRVIGKAARHARGPMLHLIFASL